MIRRLSLFALLVTAGIGVLWFVAPEQATENIGFATEDDRGPFVTDEDAGRGVSLGGIDSGDSTISITAQTSGALEIPSRKRVPYGKGFRKLLTYRLRASDSRPLGDGEQLELDDVRVTWYEHGRDDDGAPVAIPAGELAARSGIVGVGRDEHGTPSIREDRDMDLRDVEVRTLPGSRRLRPLWMRVARVRGRHTEDGLLLYTPTREEPFELELGGDRTARLTGRGMRLALPPDNAEGEPRREPRADGDAEPLLELDIEQRPLLVADGIEVRADGPLRWRESPTTQGAHVTLEDDIRIRYTGSESDGSANDETLAGRGERFAGVLVRSAPGGSHGGGGLLWRVLELGGDREDAELRRADGTTLRGTRIRIVALPGFGAAEPASWSAQGRDGRPAVLTVPDPEAGGAPARFEAQGRIRGARPAAMHGQVADARFGASLGRLLRWPRGFAERITFDGRTRAELPSQDAVLVADDGLLAWLGGEGSPRVWIGTRGWFEFRTPRMTAAGDGGFVLGRDGHDRERLRIGTAEPVVEAGAGPPPEPAFSLQRQSPSGRDLEIAGHGICTVERRLGAGDGRRDAGPASSIFVASRASDITIEFATRRFTGSLADAATLRIAVEADGSLASFDAGSGGEPCRFEAVTGDGSRLLGNANTITRRRSGPLTLLGAPARVVRDAGTVGRRAGDEATVSAARIDIVPYAGDEVALLATDPAGADGRFDLEGSDDGAAEAGQRSFAIKSPVLHYLPRRIPRRVLALHGGPAGRWFAPSLRTPWLVARSRAPRTGVRAGQPEPAPLAPVTLEQRAADGRLVTRASGARLDVRLPAAANERPAPAPEAASAPTSDRASTATRAETRGVLVGEPTRLDRRGARQRFVAIGSRVRFASRDESLRLEPLEPRPAAGDAAPEEARGEIAGDRRAADDGTEDRQREPARPGALAGGAPPDRPRPLASAASGESTLYVFGFASADGGARSSTRDMQLRCAGPIVVGEHDIRFGGPVRARSLTDDGRSIDPLGLDLGARHVRLDRDTQSGEVVHGTASDEVDVTWNGVRAQADRVEMWLDERRLLAESAPGGPPILVERADGSLRTTARRAIVDYENRSWEAWGGRMVGERTPADAERLPSPPSGGGSGR